MMYLTSLFALDKTDITWNKFLKDQKWKPLFNSGSPQGGPRGREESGSRSNILTPALIISILSRNKNDFLLMYSLIRFSKLSDHEVGPLALVILQIWNF